jgi:hypothetical protein
MSSKGKSRTSRTRGIKLLRIVKSQKRLKKYDAIFEMPNGRTKVVSFGAYHEDGTPYEDYTMHHDNERRLRYIQRHSRREPFTDPTKPGTLSRYILWEKTSLRAAIAAYKRRFHV